MIPPVCFSYILWDQIYVDNNTLVRNYLGRYELIKQPPIPSRINTVTITYLSPLPFPCAIQDWYGRKLGCAKLFAKHLSLLLFPHVPVSQPKPQKLLAVLFFVSRCPIPRTAIARISRHKKKTRKTKRQKFLIFSFGQLSHNYPRLAQWNANSSKRGHSDGFENLKKIKANL